MVFLSIYYKHNPGGYNQRLYRMYRALAERGNRVHYIATEPFPLRHANIRLHLLRTPFRSRTSLLFWAYFCAAAPLYCLWVAWRHRIDRIVVFSSFYAFICLLPKLLLRKEIVTFLRIDVIGESSYANRSPLRSSLNRLFEIVGLRLSSLVVANSFSLKQAIARRNRKLRFAVLPNDIEPETPDKDTARAALEKTWGLSADHFVIGTASRIHPVKNIGFLIEAFAMVDRDHARLVIVGDDLDGSGEAIRLKRLAATRGQDQRIVFTGWVDQPQRLVSAFDLFVMPTQREGSPNALLEALAADVICLGSRIPEIAEILADEDLLFPLASPEDLAGKIRRVINDPDYARRLSALCRHVRQAYIFDWDERIAAMLTAADSAHPDNRREPIHARRITP